MGKKDKEHRKKVAKRNQKIKQQKTGMQRAFDLLMQEQLKKHQEEDIKVQSQGEGVNFEVVEDRVIEHAFKFSPNEEESLKINEHFEGNVSFKEKNPELMSINQIPAGEFKTKEVEDQISDSEK